MDIEELTRRMIEAVKLYVARAVDPVTARLGAVEARVGALAMMRGNASASGAPDTLRLLGELEARIKALEARDR